MKEHDVYLILGSNLGNRLVYLQSARDQIESRIGRIALASQIVTSEPWGMEADTVFLNQAIHVKTELGPFVVLKSILEIERDLGRVRSGYRESRTIDIDIALYDDRIIESKILTIPHPYLPARNFALAPLAEICPDLLHPTLGMTITELLRASPDHSEVTIFEPQ